MKKFFSLLVLLCLFTPLSIQAQLNGILEKSIYFETDKSNLTTESQSVLAALNDSLRTFQTYKIRIQGNTDADGSDGYNQRLSASRVDVVRSYLVAHGVPTAIFTEEKAFGESKPIADNATEDGKQRNRRVDIQVQFARVLPEPIVNLFDKLESPLQVHQIRARQDTVLIGEKGTIVQIPADAFDLPEGTFVTLRLRESMTMSDFLMDNLSTVSGDKILFSGGMLYLDASANGKQVELNPKSALTIAIPTAKVLPEMQYFTGARDPHNKQINWTAAADRAISSLQFPQLTPPFNYRPSFERFLEQIKADTCNSPLLIPYQYALPPRKIEAPIVYAETPNFWERMRVKLGGTPKPQPKKEEAKYVPRKPETRYQVAEGLSSECRNMASFALNSGLKTASWQEIHLLYRKEWYARARAKDYQSMIQNTEYSITYEQKVYEKKVIAYEKQKTARTKSIERAIQNRIIAGKVNIDDMNAYVFQTRSLGWINCDAFYDYSPERMIVMPTSESPQQNVDIKLVFKNRKSILPPTVFNGKLVFNNIPKDEDAVIVAFKMEHGQAYLAMQDVRTSASIQNLVFQPTTVEGLREKVRTLDGL